MKQLFKGGKGFSRNQIYWFLGSLFFLFIPLCCVLYALVLASESSQLASDERQDRADQEYLNLSANILNTKIEAVRSHWDGVLTDVENLSVLRSAYPEFVFRSTDHSVRESEVEGERNAKISEMLINPDEHLTEITDWLLNDTSSSDGVDYSHAFRLFILSKINVSEMKGDLLSLRCRLRWESGDSSMKDSFLTDTSDHVEVLFPEDAMMTLLNSSRPLIIDMAIGNTSEQAVRLNVDGGAWLRVLDEEADEKAGGLHDLVVKVSYIALAWVAMMVLTLVLFVRFKNKKAEEKLSVAATVAHEFRTPITAMSVMIEGLLEDQSKTPSKVDSYLTKMKDSTHRLKQISEHFFIEGALKQQNIELESVVWTDWLEGQWSEFKNQHVKDSIEMVNLIEPSSRLVFLDDSLFGLALQNVLRNAVLYTEEGNVSIESIHEGDSVGVKIIDTGVGVSQSFQQKMFDKYSRGEEMITRSKEGLGLGLSIVKQVVTVHGGKVFMESEEGQGTTITLSIPK